MTEPNQNQQSQRDHFSQSQSPRILSLGSINADFQVRVERRPEVSETLLAEDFARFGGGKAANVAYLARRLGVDVSLFGHVGDDDLGDQALGPLDEMGVDLSYVKRVAGCPTGFSMVTVPPDGKKGIVLAPNANQQWSEEDAEQVVTVLGSAPSGSVVVVDCEVPVEVVKQAVKTAKEIGCIVVLDPSPAKHVSDDLLRQVDAVVPNPSEAEQLTGIACTDVESSIDAGKALLEKGVTFACVKLSDGGCVLVEKEGATRVTSVPVEVCDTTGAGDAFAGALAVALVEKRPVADAVRFAVAASHLTVTGYGSQTILPDRAAIQNMEQRLELKR